MLPLGLGYLDVIPLTTADTLTTLSGTNINPILPLVLRVRRAGFNYNIAKEVNVLGKFATTNSTELRTIGHFKVIESDGRKWGCKLRDEARRERG